MRQCRLIRRLFGPSYINNLVRCARVCAPVCECVRVRVWAAVLAALSRGPPRVSDGRAGVMPC
jgi:hypothetical protein